MIGLFPINGATIYSRDVVFVWHKKVINVTHVMQCEDISRESLIAWWFVIFIFKQFPKLGNGL